MMVIADTTPLNYLILIDQIHILPALFGRIVIPLAVLRELQAIPAPEPVRQWIASRPDWLVVEVARQMDPTLAHLDEGEREVIALAQALCADLLLLDESRGRHTARNRGLNVTGTIGVLDRAGMRGLLDIPTAVARLRQTRFRVAPALMDALLRRYKPG